MDWQAELNNHFNIDNTLSVWRGLKGLENIDQPSMNLRYGSWAKTLAATATLSTEYLLPKIFVPYDETVPSSFISAEDRYAANPELAFKLAEMEWGYYFYLGGGLSTMDKKWLGLFEQSVGSG